MGYRRTRRTGPPRREEVKLDFSFRRAFHFDTLLGAFSFPVRLVCLQERSVEITQVQEVVTVATPRSEVGLTIKKYW